VKFPKPGDFVAFVHTEWEESTSHWRSTNCFSGQGSHAVVGRKLFDNMETISKKKWQTTMPWTDDIPIKDIVLHLLETGRANSQLKSLGNFKTN